MESKARAGSCCWGRTKGQSRREGERDQGWMRPVPHHTHTHLSPAELNGESPLGPKSTDSLTNYLPREKRGGLELSGKSQKRAINRRQWQWQFLNRERFVSTQAAFSFSPSPSIPLPSVFLLPSLSEAINQIQSRKRKAQRKPLVEKKEKKKKREGTAKRRQQPNKCHQFRDLADELYVLCCALRLSPSSALTHWSCHLGERERKRESSSSTDPFK